MYKGGGEEIFRARHLEISGGVIQCDTQTMTPFLTFENAYLYLCLATSSLTLLITVFSLYIIMQKYRIMAQAAPRQGEVTGQEPIPRCLTQH